MYRKRKYYLILYYIKTGTQFTQHVIILVTRKNCNTKFFIYYITTFNYQILFWSTTITTFFRCFVAN